MTGLEISVIWTRSISYVLAPLDSFELSPYHQTPAGKGCISSGIGANSDRFSISAKSVDRQKGERRGRSGSTSGMTWLKSRNTCPVIPAFDLFNVA